MENYPANFASRLRGSTRQSYTSNPSGGRVDWSAAFTGDDITLNWPISPNNSSPLRKLQTGSSGLHRCSETIRVNFVNIKCADIIDWNSPASTAECADGICVRWRWKHIDVHESGTINFKSAWNRAMIRTRSRHKGQETARTSNTCKRLSRCGATQTQTCTKTRARMHAGNSSTLTAIFTAFNPTPSFPEGWTRPDTFKSHHRRRKCPQAASSPMKSHLNHEGTKPLRHFGTWRQGRTAGSRPSVTATVTHESTVGRIWQRWNKHQTTDLFSEYKGHSRIFTFLNHMIMLWHYGNKVLFPKEKWFYSRVKKDFTTRACNCSSLRYTQKYQNYSIKEHVTKTKKKKGRVTRKSSHSHEVQRKTLTYYHGLTVASQKRHYERVMQFYDHKSKNHKNNLVIMRKVVISWDKNQIFALTCS